VVRAAELTDRNKKPKRLAPSGAPQSGHDGQGWQEVLTRELPLSRHSCFVQCPDAIVLLAVATVYCYSRFLLYNVEKTITQ
jgi:hypothetical protein